MNMKLYEAVGYIDRGLLEEHFIKKAEIARKKQKRLISLSFLTASSAAACLAMLMANLTLLNLYIYGIPAPLPQFMDSWFISSSNTPLPFGLFIFLIALTLSGMAISIAIWIIGKKRIIRKNKLF